MSVRFRAAFLITGFALAACGGGAAGPATPSGPGGSTPLGKAAIQFIIPTGSAQARGRRPNYLPASTQSVVVTAMQPNGASFTPPIQTIINASSCLPGGGGLVCSGSITVPEQALMFSIVAYAAANGLGAPLANALSTMTVGPGPNALNVTLGSAATYKAISLDGGISSVMIDQNAATFSVTNVATGLGTTGTVQTLPSIGYDKLTVTGHTNSTPIGTIAYVKESPVGAAMFIVGSPSSDGSMVNGDFGAATGSFGSCPAAGVFPFVGVSIAGGGYNATTGSSYTVGNATVTGSGATASLGFIGTSYELGGNAAASLNNTTNGCTSGVFGSAGNGLVAVGTEGAVVVGNTNPNPGTDNDVGTVGFLAPTQNYSLASLASVSYDVLSGANAVVNGVRQTFSFPEFATPAGANALLACTYTAFESGTLATTGCTNVLFTGQPFPGIVTGTATYTSGTSSFVASVGIINGKYILSILGAKGSSQGVNFILMQH